MSLPNSPTPIRPLTADEIREWLDYDLSEELPRRDGLEAALAEMLRKLGNTISTPEQAEMATDNLLMVNSWLRTFETKRKQAKEPFLTAGRIIDGWFERAQEKLVFAANMLKPMLAAWTKAETERRQAQAAIEAERLRVAALAATTSGNMDVAADAARRAEEADAVASGPPSAAGPLRTAMGAVASTKRTWHIEVIDASVLPLKYMQPNQDALDTELRMATREQGTGRPLLSIPGTQVVAKDSLAIRRS